MLVLVQSFSKILVAPGFAVVSFSFILQVLQSGGRLVLKMLGRSIYT